MSKIMNEKRLIAALKCDFECAEAMKVADINLARKYGGSVERAIEGYNQRINEVIDYCADYPEYFAKEVFGEQYNNYKSRIDQIRKEREMV